MINDSARDSQLVDDINTKVVDFRERFGVRKGVVGSIIKDSCALPGSSYRGLVDSFRAGLTKLVTEAFCADFVGSHFHADTDIFGMTLRFSEGADLDGGDGSKKRKEVVDPPVDTEFIEF